MRTTRALFASAALGDATWMTWLGADLATGHKVRRFIPIGLVAVAAAGSYTARRMGPSLHSADGRGPLHLTTVVAAAAGGTTIIPLTILSFRGRGMIRAVGCVLAAAHISVAAYGIQFLRSLPQARSPQLPAQIDAIIVLGAGMVDGRVSQILARRVEKAAKIYHQLPEPKPVVMMSGGQGADEPRAESEAMYDYALEIGLPKAAIVQESQAINTVENLRRSQRILQELGEYNPSCVVVTSDFHCRRAQRIAELLGLRAVAAGAITPRRIQIHSYLREIAALLTPGL